MARNRIELQEVYGDGHRLTLEYNLIPNNDSWYVKAEVTFYPQKDNRTQYDVTVELSINGFEIRTAEFVAPTFDDIRKKSIVEINDLLGRIAGSMNSAARDVPNDLSQEI